MMKVHRRPMRDVVSHIIIVGMETMGSVLVDDDTFNNSRYRYYTQYLDACLRPAQTYHARWLHGQRLPHINQNPLLNNQTLSSSYILSSLAAYFDITLWSVDFVNTQMPH